MHLKKILVLNFSVLRVEQDQDLKSKVATIEDLHHRLKTNIESIQQLNTQVLYY